jgi:diguanylate cyclase
MRIDTEPCIPDNSAVPDTTPTPSAAAAVALPVDAAGSGGGREATFRRIYPMRVLGMGLGGLAIGGTLYAQHASVLLWGWLALSCLLWPHLAFVHALNRRDAYAAERRNLLLDSAIAGAWVPLMHFCLLPSAILVTVTTFDKLNTGMRRLWLQSIPMLFGAMIVVTAWWRPGVALDSSLIVVVCSLPLLIVHTLATGMANYHLVRTTARQNRQLEAMRRIDPQTRLLSRESVLEHCQAAWQAHAATGAEAALLMIDIDHFKSINDTHGHGVGDEAIVAVADAIRACLRQQDVAGRYGGDEFIVLCLGAGEVQAQYIAQRVLQRMHDVRELRPELRLTGSIGIAAAQPAHQSLRDWLHAADQALYRAKAEGRNRAAVA